MDHPAIEYQTRVTCHGCSSEMDHRTIEIPEIMICGNCRRIYQYVNDDPDGTINMKYVGQYT